MVGLGLPFVPTAAENTNVHTLEECTAWDGDREDMRAILEVPRTAATVVQCMVDSPLKWQAVLRFAERVLRVKEEAERARQGQPSQRLL